jgi:hypothetical protein
MLSSLLLFAGCAAWPGTLAGADFQWQTATPESQGMSSAKLDAIKDELAARVTQDFLVVRNDRIVYEWYAPDRTAANTHFTASMAKAIVGGMALAVAIQPPYPPSPVITGIEWAPPETIVRQADGSDNWPLTWADDDALYTAYGDGWGFEPKVREKLSLGLVRIEGGPEDFRGLNIRSTTGERLGQGAQGEKASGMLMVDGVLYMWIRNAGNSQLGWSKDRAKSWTWCDWKFTTSFGCPTFLNFGRNYAGARDAYVYVYSQDHDSAYEPADQFVMARVPKDRITDREAYEFFARLDGSGEPVWTRDIQERGPIFSNAGECYRSGVAYNAGLKRYLWCQIDPDSTHKQGMRFEGGFSIYDAPEPWGPWTTVFSVEHWDVGPGETSSFPTKWMSEDGKTVYLVFSGEDHFSVRKATLECNTP